MMISMVLTGWTMYFATEQRVCLLTSPHHLGKHVPLPKEHLSSARLRLVQYGQSETNLGIVFNHIDVGWHAAFMLHIHRCPLPLRANTTGTKRTLSMKFTNPLFLSYANVKWLRRAQGWRIARSHLELRFRPKVGATKILSKLSSAILDEDTRILGTACFVV